MNITLPKSNFKNILLISTLLFVVFFATSVQAGTTRSDAVLNNQGIKSGPTINIHGGSAYFSSFNESRSQEWLHGSIKQSILILPDPERFVNIDQPGSGIGKSVSLSPSTYYAHAFGSKPIYGYVKVTGTE
ncbi:hypothetical protein H7992_09505 [Sporosarcina sp. resist]|uniref:hypothetical protein n=1 Tax=Sporosarcina sp. resist TaxID=2762563 RepID=UPI00164DA710|nr:hypothetical protein [Sporosarcina sp. resist]QNK89854.1 hypothetical protein H7992_09505 [Sporosarcina sp. resist]